MTNWSGAAGERQRLYNSMEMLKWLELREDIISSAVSWMQAGVVDGESFDVLYEAAGGHVEGAMSTHGIKSHVFKGEVAFDRMVEEARARFKEESGG